jgi:hypothetical protein
VKLQAELGGPGQLVQVVDQACHLLDALADPLDVLSAHPGRGEGTDAGFQHLPAFGELAGRNIQRGAFRAADPYRGAEHVHAVAKWQDAQVIGIVRGRRRPSRRKQCPGNRQPGLPMTSGLAGPAWCCLVP